MYTCTCMTFCVNNECNFFGCACNVFNPLKSMFYLCLHHCRSSHKGFCMWSKIHYYHNYRKWNCETIKPSFHFLFKIINIKKTCTMVYIISNIINQRRDLMLHISQYVQFLLHGYIYIMTIDIKIWNNHLLEHFDDELKRF